MAGARFAEHCQLREPPPPVNARDCAIENRYLFDAEPPLGFARSNTPQNRSLRPRSRGAPQTLTY
eukprot:10898365-Lingulodinium_polyedra.AAC.1